MNRSFSTNVKYYFNRITNERIRVEPAIFLSAKGTNAKFDLKKTIDKIVRANPDAAIILDDFLSKKYNKEAKAMGFIPFMNFPTQLTLNITTKNSQVMP